MAAKRDSTNGAKGREVMRGRREARRCAIAAAVMRELGQGPSSFTHLCATLGVARGSMWRLLTKMEAAEHVTWERGRPHHAGEVRRR